MYKFNRILIGLDFSLMDRTLIEYASFICSKIQPTKIYFTHIHRNLSVPAEVVKDFPQFREPMDEKMIKEMKAKVKLHFENIGQYDVEYEVIEGAPSKELLHRLEVKNIDLLIMGRKNQLPGNGVIPKQIARHCQSSVLLVPEAANKKINHIWVPIDFSKYSKLAMEEAVMMAQQNSDTHISTLHIYDLPNFGAGITYGANKLEPMVRSNAVESYNTFMNNIEINDVPTTPIFQLNINYAGAKIAYDMAYAKKADLIIVGAQGKTGFSRILIGSFTEKLIESNTDIPLLVVKQKIDRT